MPRETDYKLTLAPDVLRWARERARLTLSEVAEGIDVPAEQVAEWESAGQIRKSAADKLPQLTHTPLGYLLLPEPPSEELPIADFRSFSGAKPEHPSPELYATLMAMIRRQSWASEVLVRDGARPLEFVGAHDWEKSDPVVVAAYMRKTLGLADSWHEQLDRPGARRYLFDRMDRAQILAVINGVMGNDTSRRLDPAEFRGFALADEYAPLVFVNGSDAISAQIFTLAHEMAHLVVGKGGLSLCDFQDNPGSVERFCNRTAAEFLVPSTKLRKFKEYMRDDADMISAAANFFCVSEMVIAYRAADLGLISRDELRMRLDSNRHQVAGARDPSSKGGGNYWKIQKYRIGQSFGMKVAREVLADRLTYIGAWRLTGLKGRSFDKYIEQLRVSR